MGRQRHLDGKRQTIRLQNDSADCSIYFNYGRGMAVGDFSASLEMTGREEVSAVCYRLSAAGCWLLAIGFQLLAFGYRCAFGNSPLATAWPSPP